MPDVVVTTPRSRMASATMYMVRLFTFGRLFLREAAAFGRVTRLSRLKTSIMPGIGRRFRSTRTLLRAWGADSFLAFNPFIVFSSIGWVTTDWDRLSLRRHLPNE